VDTLPGEFEKRARKRGYTKIAGIDEAGRGPLAGPVVAAAAILPEQFYLPHLGDSKQLSPKRREQLFDAIYEQAVSIGIGMVDPAEIDRINILQASLLAMRIAVNNLKPGPDFLLVDGIFPIRSRTRDRLMGFYDEEFPEFGFASNKGYGTVKHRAAIRTFGYCSIHRKTFRGVRECVDRLF
jgi:ribonuclease HII